MTYAINRMDKLLSDPTVMAQCAKLLADPGIMRQMNELLNNPDKVASLTDMLFNNSNEQPMNQHPPGTKVRVDGLAAHELNGVTGVVVSHDTSTNRYVVQLDAPESKQVAIKAQNCVEVVSSHEH